MGRKILLFMLTVSLLFSTYSLTYAAEEQIKLKFASLFTAVHKNALVLQSFCDEVNKRTNGKVSIALHSGSTLITGPKMAAGIATGVADIGLSHTSFSRGRFPVNCMVKDGNPADVIAAVIAEYHPSILVAGVKRASDTPGPHGTAFALLAGSRVPVLCVPPEPVAAGLEWGASLTVDTK